MVEPAIKSYLSNREKALERVDEKKMKEKLKEIKKFSISNLEGLKSEAVENLKEQGVKVFEANNAAEARRIALRLIPKGKAVVKSKSNTINEIGLLEKLEKRNKVVETDCGDFIVHICDEEPCHPVFPAIHIPLKKIVSQIRKKFGVKVKPNPESILKWIRKHLRQKIIKADIGLTGANVISADGGIFILENEGNISLVSRLPEKHIIIAGIDKIVPTAEDAMTICKAASIWGGGTFLPSYISVISSPSKTGDIQNKMLYGAHGAKEVYLILVDNGRTKMIEEGLEELLYCINCGACLCLCPIYRQIIDNYGLNYFGGRGIGMTMFQDGTKEAFKAGLYFCTTCQLCKEQCPLEIDIPELMKKLREKSVSEGNETESNQWMMENIRAMGNPFGEAVKEGKVPEKLFCC